MNGGLRHRPGSSEVLLILFIVIQVQTSLSCVEGEGYFGWLCDTQSNCFCKQAQICQKTLGTCPPNCVDNPWGIGCSDDDVNLAQGKQASQSSTNSNFLASLAVDGNNSTQGSDCALTNLQNDPSWLVDLGGLHVVRKIAVQKPTSGVCPFNLVFACIGNSTVTSNCRDISRADACATAYLEFPIDPPILGRYVRIKKVGGQILSLCEVIVKGYEYPYNLAYGKLTQQSTGESASRAVDGNLDTYFYHASCTHTANEANPWWRTDLGAQYAVYSVTLVNRGDCCGSRLNYFDIKLRNNTISGSYDVCISRNTQIPEGQAVELPCVQQFVGHVLIIQLRATNVLTLCEVLVKGYKYQACADGAFGPQCQYLCQCQLPNEVCHTVTGQCSSGCGAGWKGHGCQVPTACLPHWKGNGCFQEVPRLVGPPRKVSRTGDTVTISWDAWSAATGAGTGSATRYIVEYQADGSSGSVWQRKDAGNQFSTTVSNLNQYTDYRFRVIVVDEEGREGKSSASATFKTCGAPLMPPQPIAISALLYGDRSVAVIHYTVQGIDSGITRCESLQKIRVRYQRQGDSSTVGPNDTANPTYSIYNLIPYSNYTLILSIFNNAGLEGPSRAVYATTPEGVPPKMSPPTITSQQSDSVELSWSEPNPPGGRITRYDVRYSTATGGQLTVVDFNETTFRGTIGNLQTNVTYAIQIRAATNQGPGQYSDLVQAVTVEGSPGEPNNLENSSRTDSSLTLRWNEPIKKNGRIMGYKIICSVYNSPSDTNKTYISNSPELRQQVVENLRPSTRYVCGVAARTSVGYGTYTTRVLWTAPSPPVIDDESLRNSRTPRKRTRSTVTVLLPIVSVGDKYRIVVELMSRRRKRDVNSDTRNLTSYREAMDLNLNYYITAEVDSTRLGAEFTVGDNQTYGGYQNTPLVEGQTYDIYFGVLSSIDGVTAQTYSRLLSGFVPRNDDTAPSSDAGVIGGVIAAVVLVAVIVIVVAVILMKRRRRQMSKPSSREEIPFKNAAFKDDNLNGSTEHITDPESPKKKHEPVTNEVLYTDAEPLYGNVEQGTDIPVAQIMHIMLWKTRELMKEEYEKLSKDLQAACTAGRKPENNIKNRFKNILPYDHSRIVLDKLPDDPQSDYINANYIDGYKRSNAFIAAQGPKPNTVNDFWRMVWQVDSPLIVMVTRIVENAKAKSAEYWPNKGSVQHGEITIISMHVEEHEDFSIRTFQITKTGESSEKSLKQFHFTGWPDHGVPVDPTSLITFRKKIKEYETTVQRRGPVVVHCSAGVGRTGTFIALDYLMDQAQAEGKINIFQLVQLMRGARPKMIQTVEQYYFLHYTMLEELLCGETTIPVQEFAERYAELKKKGSSESSTKLEEQFEVLQIMTPEIDQEETKTALNEENLSKNRVRNIVPANHCRPYLEINSTQTSDYINAVFVDGHRRFDAYIVTQMPLPSTVVDFWRMIHDQRSATIVMLNEIIQDDEQTVAVYWPETGTATYGHFTVEFVKSRAPSEHLSVREYKLNNSERPKDAPQRICQFQYHGWKTSDAVPQSKSAFLGLIDEIEHWQQQSGNTRITVHCMNGAHQSGLFCAVSRIVEKTKVEQEVDVFHTIKATRINRPQFVDSLDQCKFCYECVDDYIHMFDTYANFQA
ncbi:receptor-type tyrosine-protein phosphatase kappa isoform X1 [Lingula anatina]|uniref:Receptor-type tyrosine-protein phosphatase kappa isoform X1 n=1 Tax=Lingula anatina TaxID=7574 RepID=A0A1S3JYW1_LINAN|nr:receptor-type tyrosine-protein phosphatase kappa isoform X1 [Lingula anatina]|eukprot:XP_013415221.1 receptor-type tyrosine-protein phosphatase kappa isoform X1 [Lingula anatina]